MPWGSARRHTRLGLWLGPTRVALGTQEGDRGLEVLERVEGLVDTREAQVGHLVELPEGSEDRQPHLVGLDRGLPLLADALLDPLGEQCELVLADRAALARLADPGEDLVAAERLTDAGALHHGQAGRLEGREPAAALRALPAAADRAAVVG